MVACFCCKKTLTRRTTNAASLPDALKRARVRGVMCKKSLETPTQHTGLPGKKCSLARGRVGDSLRGLLPRSRQQRDFKKGFVCVTRKLDVAPNEIPRNCQPESVNSGFWRVGNRSNSWSFPNDRVFPKGKNKRESSAQDHANFVAIAHRLAPYQTVGAGFGQSPHLTFHITSALNALHFILPDRCYAAPV